LAAYSTDYAGAGTVADELRRSPLSTFRALAWAVLAWQIAFIAPENVDGLLAIAADELSKQTAPDTRLSDSRAAAELWALDAEANVALLGGDFERSRDLTHEMVERASFADSCTFVVTAAMSEVLLGQPKAALVTVAQLDQFDLPFVDGTEVRAFAHLALGDTETAIAFIRRHAKRASLGFLPAESNDTMMLLAALAHQQGDDPAARRFLLDAFGGRSPGTIAYGRHLARQLGIFDEYMGQIEDPDDSYGATRSLNAVRAELVRRGWD
jgi:hypothetical protein